MDDCREAHDHGRLRPRRAEHVGARQVRHVVRHLEKPLGAGPPGVHHALGDALAVKVGNLLDCFFFFSLFFRWFLLFFDRQSSCF